MQSALFSPITLGGLDLPNRICVSPMCQYSSNDGAPSDWHIQHLMNLAMSGAGLIVLESTAIERRGRITHHDLGLYSDAAEREIDRVMRVARAVAAPGTKFGVQLAHAGRKASSHVPWEGRRALAAGEDPWPTIAPSALPFAEGWPVPEAMDEAAIDRLEQDYVQASLRAQRLGFDLIEIHMAHGYLLHEFHSPISNTRTDLWGGTPEKRRALLLRIARAVRAAVPDMAVAARITGTDWVPEGLQVEDAVALAAGLKEIGLVYACVSSGGNVHAHIPDVPGYQVSYARRVKQETGIVTRAVGLITQPEQAEDVLTSGSADLVAIGRSFLDDPRWAWHAAEQLGATMTRPPQYQRVGPDLWSPARNAQRMAAE